MKTGKGPLGRIKVVTGLFLLTLALTTCKNPLLTQIEEVVNVVITPPDVVAIYPANGANEIPINVEVISVSFSKAIDASSVVAGTVVVTAPDGSTVAGSITVSNDTITFTPNSELAFGTEYTVTISKDILDVDGNSLSDATTFTFRTGDAPDTTAPNINDIFLNGNAEWTNSSTVAVTIEAEDDTGIAQMNVSNSTSFSEANWTTYSSSFNWNISGGDGSRTVYIKLKDGAGNTTTSAGSDTIKVDTSPPTVESFTMEGNTTATQVSNIDLFLTGFDETGSGVSQYRMRSAGDAWPGWTSMASGSIEIQNFTLAVAEGETQILEAQIMDAAGNISPVKSLGIKLDTTGPDVLETDTNTQPQSGETVPQNTTLIQVVFNEPMKKSTFSPSNFYVAEGGTPILDKVTFNSDATIARFQFNIDENGIVTNPLTQNSDYTIFIGGSVEDIAGNAMGSDESWWFQTDFAVDDTPPEGQIVLDLDNPNDNATNTTLVNLEIKATDDYNTVYAVKIWGDHDTVNASGLPQFESEASWELYSENDTTGGGIDFMNYSLAPYSTTWDLDSNTNASGDKYIFYRFMDTAANESQTVGRLRINLDQTDPVFNSLSIDGVSTGTAYTNNANQTVTINLNAEDVHSGLQDMWIDDFNWMSDGGYPASAPWQDWSPLVTNFSLSGEGLHTIYANVRDNVDRDAPAELSMQVFLDLTDPQIEIGETNILETNTGEVQNLTTNTDGLGSGIETYLWEQISGPGTVTFTDETDANPTVSADIDGNYEIKVTATDYAGNSSFDTIPFIWDATAPGNPPGTAPNVSGPAFSTDGQPTLTWTSVDDADYYEGRVNVNGVGWSSWSELNQTSFTPPSPLADGTSEFEIVARDDAGNSTSAGTYSVTVDKTPPAIDNAGTIWETNSALGISGTVTEANSYTVLWEKDSGSGTITFSDSTSLTPTVSANAEDTYVLKLTVTDEAGNVTSGFYTFVWDTTAPNAPSVSPSINDSGTNSYHTPNTSPTWSWNSGGSGGNGEYRLKLEKFEVNESGVPQGATQTEFDWPPDASNPYPDVNNPTVTTSYNQSGLSDLWIYTLYVQERDNAGNWSSSGAARIWVDTGFTSPPNVVREGVYLRNAEPDNLTGGKIRVTWNWSTGLPPAVGGTYRYRFEGDSSWIAEDVTATSFYYDFAVDGSEDGIRTLEVEEENNSTGYTGKIGSDSVQIDSVDPTRPSWISIPSSPTNDTTPYWSWTSGGGGNGQYRRSWDGSSWTYTSSSTYTPSLSEGSYSLYVQERDTAGNWSSSRIDSVTIDTTEPTVSSFSIDSGAGYATNRNVTLNISGSGSPAEMRFLNSGYSWSGWVAYNTSYSWTLPSGDGYKYVYIQLKDAAGNISSSVSDYIYLDETHPAVNSFAINNNDTSTTSYSVTLNSDVSGANYMRMKNGDGSFTGWYAYSTSRSWNLSSGNGTKLVTVEYKDYAGNVTSTTDAIFYGTPSLNHASKGKTSNGYIYAYHDEYPTEVGTNYYYYYYTISVAGAKTYKTNTTSNSSITLSNMAEGTLFYIYLRMYNSAVGWSNYSNYAIGYSSDIAVVYDDTDTTDTNLAGDIKYLLEDTDFPASYSQITGTMPDWSVTLVPEDLVSTSWTTVDDRYIIYGDPVIITPHATDPYYNSNMARNIVHRSGNTGGDLPTTTSGKAGIIAMGYGGNLLLYRARLSWDDWNYPTSGLTDTTQYPTEIGYGYSTAISETDPASTAYDKYMVQWTTGNSIWTTPLSSTVFSGDPPNHDAQVQISYADLAEPTDSYTKRWSVYRSTDTNPTNGYLYGKDRYSANPHYFPVLRQGRFLQFGFPTLTDRPYTGKVYFINLVARMDNY